LFQRENTVFEVVNRSVEIVNDRHIQINNLIENLVQQISRTAPACKRARANLLFDRFDAAKSFEMKRHDVIIAQITVEFFGHKIRRAGFSRLDAVNDKK
jgi:hypothetical protein